MVGFWGGRESVGFVMSKVLYGTDRLAPVLDSKGTRIYLLTKPKPSPPFVYMGLGISTKKRFFYDTLFRSQPVYTLLCKKHKQKVSCSWSHWLILWVSPLAKRGGCMQRNGLEKESCTQLPLLILFRA